jgi:hypothetical protein
VWRGAIDQVITVAKEEIEAANRLCQHPALAVASTARALVTMNVHYLREQVAGDPEADVDAAVATLATIWESTIYLRARTCRACSLQRSRPCRPATGMTTR